MKTIFFVTKYDKTFLPIVKKVNEKNNVNVILIQDAIYFGIHKQDFSDEIRKEIQNGVTFYLLKEDVEKRGVISDILEGSKFINYEELVDLLFKDNQKVINL